MNVNKTKCDQCLFSTNKVVSNARRLEIIRETLQTDSFFICHKTKDVCCRGYWDQYNSEFNLGRIVQRLGGPEFVEAL